MIFKRLVMWCLAATLVAPGSAAAQASSGTLRVVVQDPSGAVIPGALVQVRGAEGATQSIVRTDIPSDAQGIALVPDLAPGRYDIEASFPGFETRVVPDVRVKTGDNRRSLTLAIQKLDESVSVGRDPATAASDPANDRFSTVLTRDQINALPDDPDEMEKVLTEMAGPGAVMRIDGFRGGKLPPKSQIRSIRFSRDMYAAENHTAGMVFVDVVTQPGLGPLRGSLDFMFRDDALNARNAFQSAKGPEQTQQYTFNLGGTLLKNRTSFSLTAVGASLYDSANVFAALPDGTRGAVPLRRPAERMNFNGRLDHSLSTSHTLRANLQQSDDNKQNLGVGNFDLSERGYARDTRDSILRLSESGPWSRSMFGESRLQVRRQSMASLSATEAPTTRVLDAFTSGGAQQAGGRTSTEVEFATNVDWALRRHSIRAGALVEGGWYRSDARSNYLGTYTFASLADFNEGRPATYTQRTGNPLVDYSQWQAGLYIQDDWRARSNLTISAGVRSELQTHLRDRWNFAPRGGFTWSPFASGKTTVRGGAGLFYDWLESETYEQLLRVDGVRQQDVIVRNPGYPDPFVGGAALQRLPGSKYVLAPDVSMPMRAMANIGVVQRLTPMISANVGYSRTRAWDRWRGMNINAPGPDGVRPDPSLGNVTQVESTGGMRGDTVNAGMSMNVPGRRLFATAHYVFTRQENNTDGAFSVPADSRNPDAEWGPATGLGRHMISSMLTTTLFSRIRVGLNTTIRSAGPYNVTTGRDDNGDAVFNDRPDGVGRNSARGRGMWDVSGRVAYAFGFGERPPATATGVGPQMMVVRAGEGADALSAFGGAGAENKRIRIELFATASNMFNTVNPVGFSGVMTSPFFGQATAALPGRRIDVGMRVGF